MATIEKPTTYPAPGQTGSEVSLEERYENFIGGHWVAPTNGEYRDNPAPPTGEPFCQVAHSSPEDIELALDAAHAAKDAWGETSVGERAAIAFGGYQGLGSRSRDSQDDARPLHADQVHAGQLRPEAAGLLLGR
jgi:Aldehyde dehydrogenase family